jgi:hypothetical protein
MLPNFMKNRNKHDRIEARDAHFAEEALAPHRVVGEVARKECQGDGLAQFQVVGAIHLACRRGPAARWCGSDRRGGARPAPQVAPVRQVPDGAVAIGEVAPGVKPPTAMVSEEARRPTPGNGARAAAAACSVVVAVRVWASGAAVANGEAHDGQNRLPSGADA